MHKNLLIPLFTIKKRNFIMKHTKNAKMSGRR